MTDARFLIERIRRAIRTCRGLGDQFSLGKATAYARVLEWMGVSE